MGISPTGERALIVGAPPLRFRSLADFLTLATPLPEPAGLSLFLPPDPFLLETFSTVRLASFFGLGTCTSLLLEKVLLFSSLFPGEARPKPPPGRGMTEAKDSEDYQRVR